MVELRELGRKNPQRSLQLAREGDAHFAASPSAPERAWFAVRALVDLRRMDEAVTESRNMVERYPGDPFALDVERHMLTHPMRHPTEVGHSVQDSG